MVKTMELLMFIFALALTMTVLMIAATVRNLHREDRHLKISAQWEQQPLRHF